MTPRAGSDHLAPLRRALGIRDRVSDRTAVGLTFDDGPHPQATPAVLDALGDNRATFFLIGEQVEKHGSLVLEISAAGHETALHAFTHRNLLRLKPGEARDDLLRGAAAIEDASGHPVRFFRPPYGYLSAAAYSVARQKAWETVLWRRSGSDWTASATPASIVRRLTHRLRGGEILVLHDSDAYATPGSWRQTVSAVPILLNELAARGLATSRL